MFQIQRPRNLKTRCVSKLSATLQRWALITALAPALTSCMGVYEGGFECPPGEGVGCKSISEVNQMVNEGELPKSPSSSPEAKTPCKGCRINEELIPSEASTPKPQIWYSPAFNKDPNNQQETIKTKVLDDPYSI
jgi:hypothetical protein